jgi:hypothetical protein
VLTGDEDDVNWDVDLSDVLEPEASEAWVEAGTPPVPVEVAAIPSNASAKMTVPSSDALVGKIVIPPKAS